WSSISPESQFAMMKRNEEAEARRCKRALTITDGCKYFGPVSNEKGELEWQRLKKITDAIKTNGFEYSRLGRDNIWAQVLVSGNQWVYFIRGGQHRVAALSALGMSEVILQLKNN